MNRQYLSSIEKWLVGGILLLLSYSAWARGGTVVALQGGLVFLSTIILVMLFVMPWLYRDSDNSTIYGKELVFRLLKDPVGSLGLLFLLLLLLQWVNAGREHVFDVVNSCWRYDDPHISFLPSAITKHDALEMLRWFFPAWVILLVLRSKLISARAIKKMLVALVVNAAVLSLFGILQYTSGTEKIFWVLPMDNHFFASFGYANHAGEFFVLMLALALGLLVNVCFNSYRKKKFDKHTVGFVVVCLLLLAGANLSLSGAGIVFSWLLMVFAVSYAVWYVWSSIRLVTRVNLVVGCIAVLCIGYFVAAGFGHDTYDDTVKLMSNKTAEHEVGVRFPQVKVAFDILYDNLWFGTGGWGYRYLFPDYADDDTWELLKDTGSANVHNDPVQFLTEFGIVGFMLMAGVMLSLIVHIWRRGISNIYKPRILYPLLGVGITVIHSVFDLPFRCPTIMYHSLVILAVIPYLINRRSV